MDGSPYFRKRSGRHSAELPAELVLKGAAQASRGGSSFASPYVLSLPAASLPRCLSRAASMCFLGSPSRAHLLVFPLTCSDRRIVVRSFVPTIAFKFRYRTATTIGYSSSPRRRLKRRYRSSVTALYVRGFLLASVRRCNCTPTPSRGSRRSPTPRAFPCSSRSGASRPRQLYYEGTPTTSGTFPATPS